MIGYSELSDFDVRNVMYLAEQGVAWHQARPSAEAAAAIARHRGQLVQLRDQLALRGLSAPAIMADSPEHVIVREFPGPVPEFAHVVVCVVDGKVTNEQVVRDLAAAREDLGEYADDCDNPAFEAEASRAEVGHEVHYDDRTHFVISLRRIDRLSSDDLSYLVQLSGGPFAGAVAPHAA